jgi:hypothetical protein
VAREVHDIRIQARGSEEETLVIFGAVQPPAAGWAVVLAVSQNGNTARFDRVTDALGWFALEISEHELRAPLSGSLRVVAAVDGQAVETVVDLD